MGGSASIIGKKKRSSQREAISPQVSSTGGISSQEKSSSTIIDGRSYHNADSAYWLPNDDAEKDRLVGQHFAMKSLFEGNFNAKVLDYVSMDDKATKVLDCGCGPGTWIMDVATDYPNCQLAGIDISDVFPSSIRPLNVHFEIANVVTGLPYEDNTFDFINIRFFIMALRVEEWPIAFKELYRLLKPGGVIQSFECGILCRGRKFPTDANALVMAFMETRGLDPHIPQKISSLLCDAGFEMIENLVKDVYLGQSDSISREFLWDVVNGYRSFKPYMAPHFNIKTDSEYDEFLKRLAIECQQEPQTVWPMTSNLARKPL
ncbi:S-adenosyl-L-methionine-dependent methyltransferase [Chlamydoabsidia padenii]|nr:S-adenosyl-L-methionine-dependent methyltransferase [Chlamydoabsidia padenii]